MWVLNFLNKNKARKKINEVNDCKIIYICYATHLSEAKFKFEKIQKAACFSCRSLWKARSDSY